MSVTRRKQYWIFTGQGVTQVGHYHGGTFRILADERSPEDVFNAACSKEGFEGRYSTMSFGSKVSAEVDRKFGLEWEPFAIVTHYTFEKEP